MDVRCTKAELDGLLLLHADVTSARCVVTNKDRAETRRVTSRDELVDPRLQVGKDRLRDRSAGQQPCTHVTSPALVKEVAYAGEVQRDAGLVRGGNNLGVADR